MSIILDEDLIYQILSVVEEIPEGTVYSLQMEVVLTNEQDHGKSE